MTAVPDSASRRRVDLCERQWIFTGWLLGWRQADRPSVASGERVPKGLSGPEWPGQRAAGGARMRARISSSSSSPGAAAGRYRGRGGSAGPAHGSGARSLCGHVGGMRTPRIPSARSTTRCSTSASSGSAAIMAAQVAASVHACSRVAVTPRRDTVRRPPLDVVDALCGKAGDEGVGPAVAGALCMAAVPGASGCGPAAVRDGPAVAEPQRALRGAAQWPAPLRARRPNPAHPSLRDHRICRAAGA